MRYALNVPNFGAFADARALAQLAHEAEDAGWNGFFLWDHIGGWPNPTADPWVALAAIAMTTSHIKLGPLVTPLPRRRPWKLARETVTLDHLSNGRLILGVGIGDDAIGREYSAYGESGDHKLHGEMLDEALDALTGLWSGEPFSFSGKHYTISDVRYLPAPVQRPRIPIWVAATLPHKRPLRRAARWDGVCPIQNAGRPVTAEQVRELLAIIHETRPATEPFDVALAGYTGDLSRDEAAAQLAPLAEAGVTWWQEGVLPDNTLDDLRAQIHHGPPPQL
jgi:alkanesulfonate monooxygenase SsuD/methylene tetrahydromethanopterin reductase-like flavin-dependent oxidoreductase (luciferase family)